MRPVTDSRLASPPTIEDPAMGLNHLHVWGTVGCCRFHGGALLGCKPWALCCSSVWGCVDRRNSGQELTVAVLWFGPCLESLGITLNNN